MLAIHVNISTLIKGIPIMDHEIRIIQYADDTVIFLDGTRQSIKTAKQLFIFFQTLQVSSGLKIIYEKKTSTGSIGYG